jgi:signal transduction histidine kinase
MLDQSKISPPFVDFNKDIQSIQQGLKKAVQEAVKGEQMKTELITNVSHDLKTPLTSIINYVDLLKGEDLKNQKAAEYLLVLEEKSGRLKQLIEDLIEASKASSGNLTVNTEKVDLNQLVMQAYGEYEERMKAAGLDIRISGEEKKYGSVQTANTCGVYWKICFPMP